MEPGMGFQYWGIWGFWTQNGGLKGDPKIEGFGGFDYKMGDPKIAPICPKLGIFAPNWGPEMEPGMGGFQWDPKMGGFGVSGPKMGGLKGTPKWGNLGVLTTKWGIPKLPQIGVF